MSLKHLIATCRRLQAGRSDFALATIIATEGSTYRKAGARMLVSATGEFFGPLGGGAFERGLSDAALRVIAARATEVVDCDMPGTPEPGSDAAGERDGRARILLQWQGPDNQWPEAELLARSIATRRSGVLITVTESTHPQVAAGTGFLAGQAPPPGLPADLADEIAATAQAARRSGKPMLVHHPADEWEIEAFYSVVRPPLHLLIAGAGADAVPLAQLGLQLGWTVSVVDPRPWLAQAGNFPAADRVIAADADRLPQLFDEEPVHAGVVMTHNSAMDDRFLRRLVDSPAHYIGVLGSKTRCEALLDGLGALRDRAGARIHAPVGLKIGAESAEEIALAIAAEILSARANFVEAAAPHPARVATAPAARADARAGLYAVILAAGAGKRFGALKQLLEFEGESLLRRSVKLANRILDGRAIVVHGPKATKCQRELAGFPVTHAVNEYWEYGMASSLKLGIRTLPADASAALVLLCDQPLVGAPQVQALVDAWAAEPERIAAAGYGGTFGPPTIIPRRYFDEVLELAGDHGAKTILARHEAELRRVPMPEAEMDIDTQDDYTRILTRNPG